MDQVQLKNILTEIVNHIPDVDARASLYQKIDVTFPKVLKISDLERKKRNIYFLDELKQVGDFKVIPFDQLLRQRERIASYCCLYGKNNGLKFSVRTDSVLGGYKILRVK